MNPSIVAAIISAATLNNVSPELLLSVCFVESSLRNIHTPNDGHSSSYGVCQVKLETAKRFSPLADAALLMQVKENANIAALYLAHQFKRYDGAWCRAVDAYNKGSSPLTNGRAIRESETIIDNNSHYCHTKYSRKVQKTLKEKPWLKH